MEAAGEWQILLVSLSIAMRALALALIAAIPLAWALSRPGFPGKVLVDALAHLPLLLPPVLIGFVLLLTLGRRAPIGHWLEAAFGIRLAFTGNGAAVATAVMILPVLVRAIRLSFEAIDEGLLEAAAVLRASPWDRFFTVTAPLAAPGIAAGGVTAFAAALGEFGAVITFAGNVPGVTQTLPLAIYAALQQPNGDALAFRLAWISFACAIVGFVAAGALQTLARRRMRA
jgi:molybdate transport system permease protein